MNSLLDLTIVICTFHREGLLAKALASIAAQAVPKDFAVKVVVVDNSDAETARTTVAEAGRHELIPIQYCVAHPANISVARNVGVAAASARWIAFIDDDQCVQPDWLEAVSIAVGNGEYDAYFGAVEPQFETPERATPLTRVLFSRALPADAGSEVFAMGPCKTPNVALATNNSLFRAEVLGAAPFDVALGRSGGEDYDVVCRIQSRGSRLGWLPTARATEFVPASRCDDGYLRRRFYTGGQTFAYCVSNASPFPGAKRWHLRARALVQVVWLALTYPLSWRGGAMAVADHRFRMAGARGKLSFGNIYPLYQNAAG